MLGTTNYCCIMLEMKNSGLMAVALQADGLTDARPGQLPQQR